MEIKKRTKGRKREDKTNVCTCVMLLLGLFEAVAVVEGKEEEGTKARVWWARRRTQHVVCRSLIFDADKGDGAACRM